MRPIVGRAAELAVLERALADAAQGRGSLVSVVGEPGIGKTPLLEQLADHAAAAGAAVAWGRCWELDGAPPFWPWIQVFRALGLAPPDGDAPIARFDALDSATRRLLDRAGPALVLLDDVHWADASSIALL